jgi:hypothetical protein
MVKLWLYLNDLRSIRLFHGCQNAGKFTYIKWIMGKTRATQNRAKSDLQKGNKMKNNKYHTVVATVWYLLFFLLDFKTVTTVWYMLFFLLDFRIVTTVWYLLFFLLDLRIVTTVWYLLFFITVVTILKSNRKNNKYHTVVTILTSNRKKHQISHCRNHSKI